MTAMLQENHLYEVVYGSIKKMSKFEERSFDLIPPKEKHEIQFLQNPLVSKTVRK